MFLPAELAILVAEFADPDDAFNFALTCKHNWNACAHIINRYASLSEEHKVLNVTRFDIWDRLGDVVDDPQSAYFVRDVTYDNTDQTFELYPDEVPSRHLHHNSGYMVSEDTCDNLIRAFERLRDDFPAPGGLELYNRVFDPPGPEGWPGDYEDYSGPGTLVTLLLHCLTHVKALRFNLVDWDRVIDPGYIGLLLREYETANPRKVTTLPLHNLRTVVVDRQECDSKLADVEWCRYFISLPSVRLYIARGIMKEFLNEESKNDTTFLQSNLKELAFLDSRIVFDDLGFVLGGIKALERLTLSLDADSEDDCALIIPICPQQILKTIGNHTSHSLQHLEITFNCDAKSELLEESYGDLPESSQSKWDHCRLSLRHFKQLKSLRCDWHVLYPKELFDEALAKVVSGEHPKYCPEDVITNFNLRTILPASLERLHLDGQFTNAEWKAMKASFFDDPDELGLTPNLKNIFIQRVPRKKTLYGSHPSWSACACAWCTKAVGVTDAPKRILKSETGEAFPCLRSGPLGKYLEGLDIPEFKDPVPLVRRVFVPGESLFGAFVWPE